MEGGEKMVTKVGKEVANALLAYLRNQGLVLVLTAGFGGEAWDEATADWAVENTGYVLHGAYLLSEIPRGGRYVWAGAYDPTTIRSHLGDYFVQNGAGGGIVISPGLCAEALMTVLQVLFEHDGHGHLQSMLQSIAEKDEHLARELKARSRV